MLVIIAQWGLTTEAQLYRAVLRIAGLSGPPSREALELLRTIEAKTGVEKDVIDENILKIAKVGVPLRGAALIQKLRHLVSDPGGVKPPRPFCCQGCRFIDVDHGKVVCLRGLDLLDATPCPDRAQKDPPGTGDHWDEAHERDYPE